MCMCLCVHVLLQANFILKMFREILSLRFHGNNQKIIAIGDFNEGGEIE